MPGLVRKEDKDTKGHKVTKASNTVYADNLPAANKILSLLNDGETLIDGSSSVFIENQPAAYLGCKTSKSNKMVQASTTVIIGQ